MIRYSLTCPKSHAFEGWFASSAAFDVQVKKKQVTCPTCGSANVVKALMAPNVVTSEQKVASRKKQRALAVQQAGTQEAGASTGSEAAAPAAVPQIAPTPEQREALKELRKLRDKILAKSDYVGPKFAEEARRMHADETPGRSIHGEASLDDVKSLVEDGIDIFPVPVLPDDQN